MTTTVPDIQGEGVLGKKVEGAPRGLDTFTLPTSSAAVSYISDEVTALCPITGAPDWYVVTVQLGGSRKGIESKSLKLYLQSFRDEGMFCEAFADKICSDVHEATKAQSVIVSVRQKPRGGVSIDATSAAGSPPGLQTV